MKTYELVERIICNFGFSPTQDQYDALTVFSRFLADRRQEAVMVMRGSAGTGKTSLAAAIVYTLHSLGQHLVLMAPTGRAAKVFSLSSGMQASTIHRAIYREKTFTGIGGSFDLNFNVHRNTLFVVDEASMIGNGSAGESGFGSGSVLYDLMRFVYNGNNCRLMLIGDKAQLPPVGEEEAPALSPQELESYGLTVYQCDLDEVLRQGHDSGILFNATMIRRMITHSEMTRLPKIHVDGFSDITVMPGNELIESLASSYSKMGLDETIVITRSNKRANIYNNGIRNSILDREEAICPGDMLMVVRNKYIPNWDLKDGTGWRGDITGRLVYNNGDKMLYIGATYSPTVSATILLGGSFHGVVLGYSYEVYTSSINPGNGSHELFVGYRHDISFAKKGRNLHKSVRIL